MKTHKSIRSDFMAIFDLPIVNTIFLIAQKCYIFNHLTLLIFLYSCHNNTIQMNTSSYRSMPSIGNFNSQPNINDTSQKIELYVSGRSLLDLDVFSKSDPYVKVYFKRSPMHKEILIGKTETVQNDLNPNWRKTFLVDYIFEAKQ